MDGKEAEWFIQILLIGQGRQMFSWALKGTGLPKNDRKDKVFLEVAWSVGVTLILCENTECPCYHWRCLCGKLMSVSISIFEFSLGEKNKSLVFITVH